MKNKRIMVGVVVILFVFTSTFIFYKKTEALSPEEIQFEEKMTTLLNSPINSIDDFGLFLEMEKTIDEYKDVIGKKTFTKGLEGYLYVLGNSIYNPYFNEFMAQIIDENLNSPHGNPINVNTLAMKHSEFLDELHSYHLVIKAPTFNASKYWYIDINYPYFQEKYKDYMLEDLFDYLNVCNEEFFYVLDFNTGEIDMWLVLNNIDLYEKFIDKHPKSPYKEKIVEENVYMYKMLFGIDGMNEIFDQSGKIKENILTIYKDAMHTPSFDGSLKRNIERFLTVLEGNNFQNNNKVDEFLNSLIREIEKK